MISVLFPQCSMMFKRAWSMAQSPKKLLPLSLFSLTISRFASLNLKLLPSPTILIYFNLQCTSVLLEAYIPVLIIGFCLQLVLPFVIILSIGHDEFNALPAYLRVQMNGVLWPKYWNDLNEATAIKPTNLMKISSIIGRDVLNPLAVMMTFGLCSPALTFLVATVAVVKCGMWVWAVRRFISVITKKDNTVTCGRSNDRCLSALAALDFPLQAVMRRAFWIILAFSTMFILFLYWDTVDDVGWEAAVAVIAFVAMLCCCSCALKALIFRNSQIDREVEVQAVSRNPLFDSSRDT